MTYATLLFVLGLFPAYVSIFFVEKYYTAFWTGLWNVYGLFLTSLGLALDSADPLVIGVMFLFALIMAVIIYGAFYGALGDFEGYVIRRIGASLVTTSINWGIYLGFTYGAGLGVVAILIHAVIMLAVQAGFS